LPAQPPRERVEDTLENDEVGPLARGDAPPLALLAAGMYARSIAPMLAVVEISDDEYMVMDTRNLEGQPNVMFLDARQVAPALVAHSLEHDDALSRDARSRLLAVEYEGCHLPLATAVPAVLARFEQLSRTPAQPPAPVVPYVQLSTPAAVG